MKDINQKVENLRQKLKVKSDFIINPIDLNLPVIPPFKGRDNIKLIIIGQDPTIKNEASRKKITCTLNLDKNNALRTYVNNICMVLGITIENVYATNVFKYFYSVPPANTMEVLNNHLKPNLDLLQQELEAFIDVPIITLGEPVLQLLTKQGNKVRLYWDYNIKAKKTNGNFILCRAKDNLLNRDFYPMPHQPSIRKEFYKNTLNEYLKFVRI